MRPWTIGIICLLMVSCGFAQEKGEQKMITVTGKLITIAAIGGETTGWAVVLDSPLQVEGKSLNSIEIDPNDKKIGGLENKRVKVAGVLEKRHGIERKEYWVIVVNEINEIE
ncbi:MAG: hypothetical protein ABSE89_04910 [Sedimentisphaerales bacterium]